MSYTPADKSVWQKAGWTTTTPPMAMKPKIEEVDGVSRKENIEKVWTSKECLGHPGDDSPPASRSVNEAYKTSEQHFKNPWTGSREKKEQASTVSDGLKRKPEQLEADFQSVVDDEEFLSELEKIENELAEIQEDEVANHGFVSITSNGHPKQAVTPPLLNRNGNDYSKFGTLTSNRNSFSDHFGIAKAKAKVRKPQDNVKLSEASDPSEFEDFAEVKDSLTVLRSDEKTLVFVVAFDIEEERNDMTYLQSSGGVAFGGYAYDRAHDRYILPCAGSLNLGELPFSFVLTMPKVGSWKMKVPIPEKVLEHHFSPSQKEALESFKSKYKHKRYNIQFIQMLGCN